MDVVLESKAAIMYADQHIWNINILFDILQQDLNLRFCIIMDDLLGTPRLGEMY